MGIVTEISAQKRNKSRVSVYIDGEFACGLDAVTVAAARIKPGDELTAEGLRALTESSELNSAFERAADRISVSPRSRLEMRRYLLDKGYSKEITQKALDKLEEYRYLDDRAFAESFVRSRSKKYGAFRIAAELRQKGVSQQIISELLDDAQEDGIYAVAQKYMRTHRGADINKLKRFLAGRGFGWDAISDVCDKLHDEGAFEGDGEDT